MKKIIVFILTEILILVFASGIAFFINSLFVGKGILEFVDITKIIPDLLTYPGLKFLILIFFIFLSAINLLSFFTNKNTNLGMQQITPDIEIPISAGKTLDSAEFLPKNKFKKAFTVYKYTRNSQLNKLYSEGEKTISKIKKMKVSDLVRGGEKFE